MKKEVVVVELSMSLPTFGVLMVARDMSGQIPKVNNTQGRCQPVTFSYTNLGKVASQLTLACIVPKSRQASTASFALHSLPYNNRP
jgi:hypothetical protein